MALPPTPLSDLLYGLPSADVPDALAKRGWLSPAGASRRDVIIEMGRAAHAEVARRGAMPGETAADLLADRLVASELLNEAGRAAHDPI